MNVQVIGVYIYIYFFFSRFYIIYILAFFRFIGFERLHKHTYMRQNPRLCKYPHKRSDVGLKREKTHM